MDFKIGHSPERVNPGDRQHIIEKVVKVVSGMDEETLSLVASVYGCITEVFKAKSIKVAEAAKVIENTQRDLNIALMNELAKIFSKMDISVYDVLAAANTKWNFLKFTPGLVGGHCIGVDPYYLTYKAQSLGFEPEVILAGRKTNDSMGFWMVENILEKNSISVEKIRGLKVLIAGITFKENVPDIRNSKVVDIYKSLVDKGITPDVCDPIADVEDVKAEYGIVLSELNTEKKYDLVILAVAHEEYKKCGLSYWQKYLNKGGVLADVKGVYFQEKNKVPELKYWTV